jgi:uncharacterized membrane protein YecN with MAPEG domain
LRSAFAEKVIRLCRVIVSLIAILATMAHAFSITGSPFQSSMFDLILTVISPIVLAVFLVWYSKYAGNRGWVL